MMKRGSNAGQLGAKTGPGLPSQEATERNDASSKVVRLREAGHRFEAQIRKLERQFDARAKKLSEEFLSEVDQLNGEE
jgi:hypothetical protein